MALAERQRWGPRGAPHALHAESWSRHGFAENIRCGRSQGQLARVLTITRAPRAAIPMIVDHQSTFGNCCWAAAPEVVHEGGAPGLRNAHEMQRHVGFPRQKQQQPEHVHVFGMVSELFCWARPATAAGQPLLLLPAHPCTRTYSSSYEGSCVPGDGDVRSRRGRPLLHCEDSLR